jgi:hypothetical protein
MLAPENSEGYGPGPAVAGGVGLVVVSGTAAAASQTSSFGPVLAFGAAVLAFVGAVLAAWIAASSARQRQQAELAAVQERQRAELDAEALRLDRQLSHARELSDLQHLRELIDEAARLYEVCLDRVIDVVLPLHHSPPSPPADYVEQIRLATRAQMDVVEMDRRLQLRFADDDPLVNSYDAVREAFANALQALPAPSKRPSGTGPDDWDPQLNQARRGFNAFCRASRARLAVAQTEPQASTK